MNPTLTLPHRGGNAWRQEKPKDLNDPKDPKVPNDLKDPNDLKVLKNP